LPDRWPLARRLPGWLAFIDRLLAPDTRVKRRFPGSSCVPGVAPGVVPVSGSDVFLLPREGAPQGVPGGIFKIV
jgi:hypothetical protein